MKKAFKILGIVLGVLLVGAVGTFLYAKHAAAQRLDRDYSVEVAKIPIPFPLTEDELRALRTNRAAKAAHPAHPAEPADVTPEGSATTPPETEAGEPTKLAVHAATPEAAQAAEAVAPSTEGDSTGTAPSEAPTPDGAAEAATTPAPSVDPLAGVDLDAIALQRALARGKRYLESRAGCADCHGEDYGGKVVVDHPMLGKWVAPNITRGGVTKDYEPEDWVRIIRHGIKPDGKPATMPSLDFTWFSDQEISDIAAYIEGLPPVDRVMPPSEFGPVFTFLMAFEKNQISAEFIDHAARRPVYPPAASVANLSLGKHLAATCMGCHGPLLAGGKIAGGDPDWPPASNLTFHESGLAKWSLTDFQRALREGKRPDGRPLDPVMPVSYTKNLGDAEIEALYLFFQSLPKVPLGTKE